MRLVCINSVPKGWCFLLYLSFVRCVSFVQTSENARAACQKRKKKSRLLARTLAAVFFFFAGKRNSVYKPNFRVLKGVPVLEGPLLLRALTIDIFAANSSAVQVRTKGVQFQSFVKISEISRTLRFVVFLKHCKKKNVCLTGRIAL